MMAGKEMVTKSEKVRSQGQRIEKVEHVGTAGNDKLMRAGKYDKAAGEHVLTHRNMPESLAAEAAVLGSMIIDPECIGDVIEIVKQDSFYRIEHQYIFAMNWRNASNSKRWAASSISQRF